jgi:hypothetical protein
VGTREEIPARGCCNTIAVPARRTVDQLNIAEGSADYHPKEKARFYRIARRSAHECCAVLDNFDVVLGIPIEKLDPYYHRLTIIISKLVHLDKSMMARAKSSSPRKRGQ